MGDLEGILVEGPHRASRAGRVDLEALDNLPGPVLAQGKEVLPTSRLKNEKLGFRFSASGDASVRPAGCVGVSLGPFQEWSSFIEQQRTHFQTL